MHPRGQTPPWATIGLLIVLLVSLLPAASHVPAAQATTTILVTTTTDRVNTDGLCSLREAVIAANKDLGSSSRPGECPAGSGADTIEVPAGTYVLTRSDNGNEDSSATGDLDIRGDVTIRGSGRVTIGTVAGFRDRVFHILYGTVHISGMTISGGSATSSGGAILNAGQLTMQQTTLSGNRARIHGGGLANTGTATLENVTISGNTADRDGGGLIHSAGSLSLRSVTIAANTADADRNGSGNGGGLAVSGGTARLRGTLLATNNDLSAATNHPDCSGPVTSDGYNLVQQTTGCSLTTGPGDRLGISAQIGSLQDNGGTTWTHALLGDSPAIDGVSLDTCAASDQRGISRPQGAACDIGAFEAENPLQMGPVFTANSAFDVTAADCTMTQCTLRAAILAANARPNDGAPDQIVFAIPGGAVTITPASPLPPITDAVLIDGTTQPGGRITLDGGQAGAGAHGLTIAASGVTVRGLIITGFQGDGLHVSGGTGNTFTDNSLFANGGLGIGLGDDGPTPNDPADSDSGPNHQQNTPVLLQAISTTGRVHGRLNSVPGGVYTLDFYASTTCDPSGFGEGATYLGAAAVATDATGDVYFAAEPVDGVPDGGFVTATATAADGSTSEFSNCQRAGADNVSWPQALPLTLNGPPLSAAAEGYLDRQGQSRWYRVAVQPGARVTVTLTGLPANYDLTVYRDIAAAFASLATPQDLVRLGAEFAPDAFSPDAFSPDAFSPDAFSPDAFSPDAFSPDAFSPDAFSPDAFSPDAFSPDAFSPDAFSPDAFSPDAFSPDAFSPDAFSPDAFSPDAFSPDAFSSAQSRSLVAVSAFPGVASEGVALNTWDNTGDFYVRVRGRNGAFDAAAPFRLHVTLSEGVCAGVGPITVPPSLPANAGDYQTIVLLANPRLPGTAAEKAVLSAQLAAFAARPEVNGVIVDVDADARVAAAYAQADQYPACPYAQNLVATAIKDVVDRYRAVNPLAYVVIAGGDAAIPFFRHPDHALLANEKNYVPPVRDNTASQSSLRLGYVLSQDDYGAITQVAHKDDDQLPLPGLAIGRLVETAGEITGQLEAYLATPDGILPTPDQALVTGYDFLEDAAQAVSTELTAGLGGPIDTLIAPRTLSPQDPAAWTANDLRAALFGVRHDIIFLAGHFSASSALAADYSTRVTTQDLLAAPVDLENALIYSAGCHAGYNIVDAHGVPGVTREPDWAQAFARQRAIFIGGTGYQYGDTDFIEYSERLYLEFTRQLRTGSGPVAVGQALASAKQVYLAATPQLRGIHEKAYLEATLFGLPMVRIDLPGTRRPLPPGTPSIAAPTPVAAGPGQVLGLSQADVHLAPALTMNQVTLTDVSGGPPVAAHYLSGPDGIVAAPAEPALPLAVYNVTAAEGVLRGVGFRGGTTVDHPSIVPLIGAPTTEVRGVHAPFVTDVWFPIRPWSVNYVDALAGGVTRLALTPAQFLGNEPLALAGTLRQFTGMDLRLYYSANVESYGGGSVPALSDAPTLVSVTATPVGSTISFDVRVTGNPAAGVHEAWVVYTATTGPLAGTWTALDLVQDPSDSTRWTGQLNVGSTAAADVRFVVQAVNGVGLVALNTNQGAYYIPGDSQEPDQPTELTLWAPPSTGAYGTRINLTARLTSAGLPLADQIVLLRVGPQSRQARTDADGRATATLSLLGWPGPYEVRATFDGTATYLPAAASSPMAITKQATVLTLTPTAASGYLGDDVLLTATLGDVTGRRLGEKTVFFVISGSGGTHAEAVITDYAGRAPLGSLALPPGDYAVAAYFAGTVPLPGEPLVLTDERYLPAIANGMLELRANQPPVCSGALPSQRALWPPDKTLRPVSVLGVSDPDGDPITITILSIRQDEPVGNDANSPDGFGVGTASSQVRAERDGNGDGRVYHIYFLASDHRGATCTGEVLTGTVSHDQGGNLGPIDGGPLYDSTVPDPP